MNKDIIPLIASVVAGLFTIATAFLAWKLNLKLNKHNIEKEQKKIKREDTIELYTDIYIIFEKSINQVRNHEEFSLYESFTKLNARIHL